MRRIESYLQRQLLWPTVAAVVALTGVALLALIVSPDTLNLLTGQRQSALTVLKIVALNMPSTAVLTLPVALFVACLASLNRLHTEQEIVVCFAGGMSRWRVGAPALRLATAAALATLVVNLWVQPWAERRLREELFVVRTDLVATLVHEGDFADPSNGLTVYAQTADTQGRLANVFVYQEKDDHRSATFAAKRGLITKQDGKPVMILSDGSNQQFSNRDVLQFLKFDDYVLDLSPYVNATDEVHYKTSDRYLHELVFPDKRQDWERSNRKRLAAEANARLSTPLYSITFAILALYAVIGGPFSRTGYGRRIAYAAAAAAALRILGFAAQAASEGSQAVNLLQWLVPVLPALWAGGRLFMQRNLAPVSLGGGARLRPLGAA